MPQYVDAGNGQRYPARRDRAANPSRRCRRHRGVAAGSRHRRSRRTAGARDSLMPSTRPKTSPAIEKLIEGGLFDRLPVTFSAFFFDQIQEWDLLFPAEKNYYERFLA